MSRIYSYLKAGIEKRPDLAISDLHIDDDRRYCFIGKPGFKSKRKRNKISVPTVWMQKEDEGKGADIYKLASSLLENAIQSAEYVEAYE